MRAEYITMACTSRQVRQGLCVVWACVWSGEHSCITIAGPHWWLVLHVLYSMLRGTFVNCDRGLKTVTTFCMVT